MRRPTVIHPLLFAIFPSLFLFSRNTDHFPAKVLVGPLLASVGLAVLVWSLSYALHREWRKSGLLASVFLILFFSYGHVINLNPFFELVIGRIRLKADTVFMPIWGILLVVAVYLCAKARQRLDFSTRLLNVVSAFLVLSSLGQMALSMASGGGAWGVSRAAAHQTKTVHESTAAAYPDIYYVILDGYARADILKEMYGYDNTEFLDALRARGFRIPSKSRSNYCQTALSLSSSLNMDYLDGLVDRGYADSSKRMPLAELIQNSVVLDFLKQRGYTFVAFSSDYFVTSMPSADVHLSPEWRLDQFDNAFINTTALSFVLRKITESYRWHRESICYVLDRLGKVPETGSPRFVFAHIVSPHPPFVFGRDGRDITPERRFSMKDGRHTATPTVREYQEGYREQLIYLNRRILEAVDEIMAGANQPPVIVIQADHGPGSWLEWHRIEETDLAERLSIFNALYLPQGGDEQIYEGLTPVNTFRIILNRYFGTNHELLDDRCYFSSWDRPYQWVEVTQRVDAGPQARHLGASIGLPRQ